ncbi:MULTISPECIES: DMT family transporter [Pseudoalteromonas]|jgi:quaternary ammonium compound-resistance protein SugE|uniref:Guanidinium exporter n=1 Tax=Pseudoalteromonas arctica A 37-1-2 TaxID=1117313 RepID=A0A290S7L7_9GAMM|nr:MULTISPECIES: multidrug efflux SMR transporter [Pseudoalteromonas]ATC88174.1 quaternary ammonium compound-resistance protein SugE [Pseudoalteromonas arctica A 37-1-2]MBG9999924.1 multidrug efflux SMR transporter [Pseudoalteromonas sp. NSLLW24]MBH0018078.1 multidrug efflux SMR transporter [Pseudoalteromonas sp. NGC95]MBH0021925.1 multidrug efflux SMR transporter [Pseudoalteromonas sp. SWXJ133]MBH0027958.1 multidrug efflux SMR transporter [Pseudoalteromonas sp. SWN29]
MAWIYLVIAGLLEIGWPIGLKISQNSDTRWQGIAIAVAFLVASGFMLWLAQRQISMGTSYAVWTGIGAAGTFLVGILFYNDAATFGRIAGVLMIISGVITLKISS